MTRCIKTPRHIVNYNKILLYKNFYSYPNTNILNIHEYRN